jgi:hypothetical protein
MKTIKILVFVVIAAAAVSAQDITGKEIKKYESRQAFEVESLFPMFFYGGYHAALGYRFERFRIRASIINGGDYNAEPAGLNNSKDNFKRYYKTSPGIFFGYNVWKYLDVYTYLEFHTYSIEQKSTGIKKDLKSVDYGFGTGYQFFIGDCFYIQPALHLYLRGNHGLSFAEEAYKIPRADFSPVIRIGVRLWDNN